MNVLGTVRVGLIDSDFTSGVAEPSDPTIDAQSPARGQVDHEHADRRVRFDIGPERVVLCGRTVRDVQFDCALIGGRKEPRLADQDRGPDVAVTIEAAEDGQGLLSDESKSALRNGIRDHTAISLRNLRLICASLYEQLTFVERFIDWHGEVSCFRKTRPRR